MARLSKKAGPQSPDKRPRPRGDGPGWPEVSHREHQATEHQRIPSVFPSPVVLKVSSGEHGGTGRGSRRPSLGICTVKIMFIINLPLPLLFSHECWVEFSRDYLIRDIMRMNECRSRNENPALLLSPTGKRLAKGIKWRLSFHNFLGGFGKSYFDNIYVIGLLLSLLMNG